MSYTGTKAQSGQGTTLQITSSSPPVMVGEIIDAAFSDKNEFDDATNLSSTAKEFTPLLPDPGKLTCTVNRVSNDPGQLALRAAFAANPPTKLQLLLTLPVNTLAGQSTTGDTRAFAAYVESISPDIKTNKITKSNFVLQITGPITEEEGS